MPGVEIFTLAMGALAAGSLSYLHQFYTEIRAEQDDEDEKEITISSAYAEKISEESNIEEIEADFPELIKKIKKENAEYINESDEEIEDLAFSKMIKNANENINLKEEYD